VGVGGVNVFLWHVHGSWTTNFVQGKHDYFVPVTPDRGPDGRGRARTWDWPTSVREVTSEAARDVEIDVVILQRPEELAGLAAQWLGGRRPGLDLPAVYLEHNTPQGFVNAMRHPAADRSDIVVVHVTPHNALFWDAGLAPTVVIEHGVLDPGDRYRGELPRAAVVVNEPLRRHRVVGADLLSQFATASPLDVFGMETEAVGGRGDVPQAQLHDELARRRSYLHPYRWTSLGLALIEAMLLGMPVVAIGTAGVNEAVPPEAGVVSTRIDVLKQALRTFNADPELATAIGKAARVHALEAFGLERFLEEWDRLLVEVAR